MATTAAQARAGLNDIANQITRARANLDSCKALSAQVEADLTNLNAQYAGLVADINAQVTAAPTDTYWVNIKSEKDKMVTEFTALKTSATAMKNATAGVAY